MSNADFKLTSEQIQRDGRDSVTVFTLKGWLDAQSEEKILSGAQEARYLLIDLEDVNTLTSAGIRRFRRYICSSTPGNTRFNRRT